MIRADFNTWRLDHKLIQKKEKELSWLKAEKQNLNYINSLKEDLDWTNDTYTQYAFCCQIIFSTHLPYSEFKLNTKDARVLEIAEKLRIYKAQFKISPSSALWLEIKNLVNELHKLISFQYRILRGFIRHHKRVLFTKAIRDIRNELRNIVRSFMKLFNDFSGCEEDAITVNKSSKNIFPNNQFKSHDKQKRNYQCFRCIYQ